MTSTTTTSWLADLEQFIEHFKDEQQGDEGREDLLCEPSEVTYEETTFKHYHQGREQSHPTSYPEPKRHVL